MRSNRLRLIIACCLLIIPALSHAKSVVVKQTLGDLAAGKQILTNGDLEKVTDGQIEGIKPWDQGYVIDSAARSGKVAARTDLAPGDESHKGLTYTVTLDQKQPVPFTAELWSKAKDVSGTADSNYSLYIDLVYMDGSPLWGNIAPFSPGTHDWEKRTVTLVPDKPVKEVSFHAIFRNHSGTAWFDDFAFYLLDLPAGAATFDGVPVLKQQYPRPTPNQMGKFVLGSGVSDKIIVLDEEGRWVGPRLSRPSGIFLRDATRRSDFRQPLGTVTRNPKGGYRFEATDEELGLKITADYSGAHTVRVEGTIEDLTGQDRGVSIYCSLPMAAQTWHDDMRTSRKVEEGQTYANTTTVGCGATGKASLYPFGCVTDSQVTTCLGTVLDPPRLYRFAYDATSAELYGVQDLGLSKDTKTPGKATFSFIVYATDVYRNATGFRGALSTYYWLFPDYFKKRTTVEGNWMAFDDIAAVTNPEDFHFAFKEGTNNPEYDEAHGILTYTYVEPMSYWLAMGKLPRTPEAALKLLEEQAAQKPPHAQAAATLNSAVRKPDGTLHMSIENTPWCDGALFLNNPDPDIPVTPELPVNQGAIVWKSINNALGTAQSDAVIANWRPWEEGFAAAPGQGRNASQAAHVNRPAASSGQGLGQFVTVGQTQPGKLLVSAWCKTENVTGEPDNDFSLYCDLNLKDGEHSWGHMVPFTVGTHDWERKELVIDVPAPIQSLSLWLLVRGNHTGKVWFDEVSVTAEGSDKNLVQNPGLEPKQAIKAVIDGTYIDSLEMGASLLDFDRRHWRAADSPLVFTTGDGLPAQLLMFASYEFIKDVSEKMHAQGKTIFANAALHRFAQPAAVLDVMGTETNWNRGENWMPMHDADANFKRAMCYQRPYLLLQNTIFEEMPVEKIEKYMKRSIFYGLFPSFFSHNAAERTYWTRPEIYNRDRHLFKKYLPAAKTISAAGWEPLTGATTGNKDVYLERWGKGDKIYFTLFNPTDQPQQYTLTLDATTLGLPQMPKQLTEIITNQKIDPGATTTLAPEDLQVLAIGL